MKSKKIALFHPWIKSRGGAEKVVLEILKNSKHKIDLYTWIYEPKNTFKEFQNFKIKIIAPKISKKISRKKILRGLFLPWSFIKKIPLKNYDIFLISTSGVAEFVTFRNYKKGKTFAYVHTPLREADEKIIKWNLKNQYKKNLFKKYLYLLSTKIYLFFEKRAWKKLDKVVFNSEFTKDRAKKRKLLKDKPSKIIYPPIDFKRLKRKNMKVKKQFIYVSRLNPPKRQDILIEAWKKFSKSFKDYELVIVGSIEDRRYYEKLKELSKDFSSIKIKTKVSNSKLAKLINSSMAGIFLGYQEDAGIVPLEKISLGKPLLAVDEGGYVSLIKENELFYKISEKHDKKKMIKEISKRLEGFISKYKKPRKVKKIKTKDFIKEIEKFIDEN